MSGAATTSGSRVRRALSLVAGATAVVVGLVFVLVAVTLGDCSAFGGRCPSEPDPLLQDDVFGIAAFGAALASGVPVFLTRRSRRLVVAIAVAAVAGVGVGLIARAAANN